MINMLIKLISIWCMHSACASNTSASAKYDTYAIYEITWWFKKKYLECFGIDYSEEDVPFLFHLVYQSWHIIAMFEFLIKRVLSTKM
jgi:hypothetical protein